MNSDRVTSHSQNKRDEMGEPYQWVKSHKAVVPAHGQEIPSPSDGWVPNAPTSDAVLYIAGVKSVRMTDGSTRKFYRLLVRPAEVKRKYELVKKKLKEIRREIRRAEQKEAKHRKRQVRLVLAMLGKS